MIKIFIFGVVVLLLSGCLASSPYEEKIEGSIFRDGKSASDIKVRFVSNYSEASEPPGLEAITDKVGNFSITQKYSPIWFERIDVVIHSYRLLIFLDGRWQTAWSLQTGPAPRNVAFKCYLDASTKKVEKCLVSWEKQPFREMTHNQPQEPIR